MFCPNCKAEFREGFTVCSDCDLPLVASLDDIPREYAGEMLGRESDEEGGGDTLEPLHETRNPEELGALVELLEDARVPYALRAGTALALLVGEELAEPGQPDFWEARVLVHAPQLRKSRQLLADLRAERAAAGLAAARRSALD